MSFFSNRSRCAAVRCLFVLLASSSPALSTPGNTQPTIGPERARLVLLYAPCTVRRDFLAPYNGAIPFTPALKAFSREGVVFTKHRTEAGQSGVAYASIFSGRQAPDHGVFRHPTRIADSVKLISEVFSDGGYEVFFWFRNLHASPELNYAQDVAPEHWRNDRLLPRDPLLRRILDRLKADPSYKALVIYQGSVSHAPYDPTHLERFCLRFPGECLAIEEIPAEKRSELQLLFKKNMQSLQFDFDATVERLALSDRDVAWLESLIDTTYRSRLHVLDTQFGSIVSLVDREGLRAASIVAFTADHGEYVSKPAQFKWAHGFIVARSALDVAWIIRAPELLRPRRIDSVTRSIDLLPTLAGLAGIEYEATPASVAKDDLNGVDLAPFLLEGAPLPPLTAFSHGAMVPDGYYSKHKNQSFARLWELFPRPDPEFIWVAARKGDRVWKLTRPNSEWKVSSFDLVEDRDEVKDLYTKESTEDEKMAAQLWEYKKLLRSRYWASKAEPKDDISEERKIELLRSMGYIQ